MMQAKTARAVSAVIKNRAKLFKESNPNVAKVSATRQNTPRGKHFKTRWVTWIIVLKMLEITPIS